MSFLADDKQEFRLSDLNIIGNPDSICRTIDFVNNKAPFGKIPLAVDLAVANQYYTKLFNDITAPAAPERSSEAGLDNKSRTGYTAMSKQELQEMLKPFSDKVAYDEKSNTLVSRGNVKFSSPNGKSIDSYPVVDFKWKPSSVKHDQKSLTNILTTAIASKTNVTELVNTDNVIYNYPLFIPVNPVNAFPVATYLGFISFGVYYPERDITFRREVGSHEKFLDEINNTSEGKRQHVPMPLLLAYNIPDGVYSHKIANGISYTLFIDGMCHKSITIYKMSNDPVVLNLFGGVGGDTYSEDIMDYINGELIESKYLKHKPQYGDCHITYDNRHICRAMDRYNNDNNITNYIEYDTNGLFDGISYHLLNVNQICILTYKHGKVNGPFELRNSNQDQDFLLIGTFGNFSIPFLDTARFTVNNLESLIQYTVGKLFRSTNNSKLITVNHFNDKHQLHGISEAVTNIEEYSSGIINMGERYSTNNISVIRHYYIDGTQVTPKVYTTYVTQLKEGIATIGKGKDVTSLITSYLV